MDLILNLADQWVLTPYVYPPSWREQDWTRQTLSVFVITTLGGYFLYLTFASVSYVFLFDKRYMTHPKHLKDQIRKEIAVSCSSIPIMTLYTLPIFMAEIYGYSKLYDRVDEYGLPYLFMSVLLFMFFNDMLIYWIHRLLHHPRIYKHVHKTHHRWLIPTPFASHAFDALDGFLQSTPYHIFVFLIPLNKVVYLTLFVIVNFWTISIHDGYFTVPESLRTVINGAAHHTDHHLYYNYNYGQYFTLWDRLCGSYKHPTSWDGTGPLEEIKLKQKKAKAF